MSPIDLQKLLSEVQPDRRSFIKRLVLGTTYAVPVISAFSMDVLNVDSALAQVSNICVRPHNNRDVTIRKTAAPEPAIAGQQLTYTLTIQVCGDTLVPAQDVFVEDVLPAGVTFVSAAQTLGATVFTLTTPAIGAEGGTVTASAAFLSPDELHEIEIVVLVNP